jgi:hypothetical protein
VRAYLVGRLSLSLEGKRGAPPFLIHPANLLACAFAITKLGTVPSCYINPSATPHYLTFADPHP